MEGFKLYGVFARAHKVLATANWAGVPIESLPFEMGVTNKTPEYLATCPTGKIPCLVTPDGSLFESNAICRFVALAAKSDIYPADPFLRSQVDSWVDASISLDKFPPALIYTLMGYRPYVKEDADKAWEELDSNLAMLDSFLASRTYFVGESVTLADIIMMSQFITLWLVAFGAGTRRKFPHLTRWLEMMLWHPHAVAAIGVALQPPEKPVVFHEGAANAWGEGPNPMAQIVPKN